MGSIFSKGLSLFSGSRDESPKEDISNVKETKDRYTSQTLNGNGENKTNEHDISSDNVSELSVNTKHKQREENRPSGLKVEDNHSATRTTQDAFERHRWKFQDLYPRGRPDDFVDDSSEYQNGISPLSYYRKTYRTDKHEHFSEVKREDNAVEKDSDGKRDLNVPRFESVGGFRGRSWRSGRGRGYTSRGGRGRGYVVIAPPPLPPTTEETLLQQLRAFQARVPLVDIQPKNVFRYPYTYLTDQEQTRKKTSDNAQDVKEES